MKFYCLHEGFYEGVKFRLEELKSACKKLNIDFIAMNSLAVDYSNLPILKKSDLLYNATRGSETLETLLLNKDVTTFYIKNPNFIISNSDTTKYSVLHEKANLPTPKTIFDLTSDRKLLENYVHYLGGFPLIIKTTSSTRGIGTIKVESWQSLISIVDYLNSINQKGIIREFIPNSGTYRLIVLLDDIIVQIYTKNILNDFRVSGESNERKSSNCLISNDLKEIAIASVKEAGLELGAVDILLDEQDNPYILEVNFPFGFSIAEKISQRNIAEKMISYLIEKSILNNDK